MRFPRFSILGAHMISGQTLNDIEDFLRSTKDGIVAFAGGGQASATQLVAAINRVSTVASGNDSVKLPPAIPGMKVMIFNDTANSLQVFGSGTDTINAVATATGVAQAAGKSAEYVCYTAGPAAKWARNLSA